MKEITRALDTVEDLVKTAYHKSLEVRREGNVLIISGAGKGSDYGPGIGCDKCQPRKRF